jgi:Leucine-rich repeat (LRR) protein
MQTATTFDAALLSLNPDTGKSKKIRLIAARVDDPSMSRFCDAIVSCQSVRSLEITACQITESVIDRLLSVIPQTAIVCLQLLKLNISKESALKLASYSAKLRRLELSINNIGDEGVAAIVQNMPLMEILCLGYNNITEIGGRAIASAILTNLPAIVLVDLRGNKLGPSIFDIFEALPQSNIQTIQLDTCDVTTPMIKRLCELLPSTSVRNLGLSNNALNAESIQAIAQMLPTCRLEKISMGGITEAGCQISSFSLLTQAIKQNATVKYLDFRATPQLTDNHALLIMDAIKTHMSIEKILLSNTEVSLQLIETIHQHTLRLHSKTSTAMITLCSSIEIHRLRVKAKFIPWLTTDLLRVLHSFLT